ncbi:hypothetical protein FACS1894166_02990 [Bacilli bacterium]|nr:hypothetical protein FACS1894166_02990 [Bacilli bacterium]
MVESHHIKKSKRVEFHSIKNSNTIGIIGGSGKYSEGTFADIDIALEFTRSISPIFALYVNTEFIRLKKAEQNIIP